MSGRMENGEVEISAARAAQCKTETVVVELWGDPADGFQPRARLNARLKQ